MTTAGPEAPLVDPADLPGWILRDDDDLLVVNKPGWLVCHPSKNGPLSSLVGAVSEYAGGGKRHLVARLDRETSGLVVFAKRPAVARKLQMAFQKRLVRKRYLAVLEGRLEGGVRVEQPIARRPGGPVFVKSEVREDRTAQDAVTEFAPLAHGGGRTLCEVVPVTGRKHQIRVHAAWLGHPVTGDKIYGPDETLYLEFIERGWTKRLEAALPIQRQALHCAALEFAFPEDPLLLEAPPTEDFRQFCEARMGMDASKFPARRPE